MYKNILFAAILSFILAFSSSGVTQALEYSIPIADLGLIEPVGYDAGFTYNMANFQNAACEDGWSEYTDDQETIEKISDFCKIISGTLEGDHGITMMSRNPSVTGDNYEAAQVYYRADKTVSANYYDNLNTSNGSFKGLFLDDSVQILEFVVSPYCNRNIGACVDIYEDKDTNTVYYLNIVGKSGYQTLPGAVAGTLQDYFVRSALYTTFRVNYPEDYSGSRIPKKPKLGKFSSFSNIMVFSDRLSFTLQNPSLDGLNLPYGYGVRYRLYDSNDELIYSKSYSGSEFLGQQERVDLSGVPFQMLRLETYVFISPPFAPADDIIVITPVTQMINFDGSTYTILGGSDLEGCTDTHCEVPVRENGWLDPYGPLVKGLSGGPLSDIVLLPLRLSGTVMGALSDSSCQPLNFDIPFHNTVLKINAKCMNEVYSDIGYTAIIEGFGLILSTIIFYNTYVWFAKYIDDLLSLRENSAGLWGGI